MKIRRDKYQQVSIRRVKRANGFAWEFWYYVKQNGKRVLRSQYFDGALYRTEKAVRQKVESQLLKLNISTFQLPQKASSEPTSDENQEKTTLFIASVAILPFLSEASQRFLVASISCFSML